MLEKNNIYLGDSYKLIKEIPDASIDCIYTDVPYLYDFGGGGNSPLAKRIIKTKNELDSAEITKGFYYEILDEFIRISKKVNIFIWCSKLQLPYIMNYFAVSNNYNFELLVWCKSNPTPMCNNVWLPDVEYCLYFREKGVKLNDGYEHKSKWFLSSINKSDKDAYDHPTIKPLELVKRHLKHTTQPGDVVLDCFLGSGTTAVAAKELGRQYIGFEIDEKFYNIAKDRLDGITQIERRQKDAGIQNIFDFMEEE